MPETNSLVTLDYIVKSWFNWKGIALTGDYDRYKQILIEGFTDLNIFHTDYYKGMIGVVNAVNQMQLPSDFIDWLVVAVEHEGLYWELDKNENIIVEPSNLSPVPVFDEHVLPPPTIGYRYTAQRRNQFGQFNVNKRNRVITFVGDFAGKNVYVFYSSSGVPTEGEVFVPRELVTVLRTFLEWQLKEADDMIPMNLTQKAENAHGRALRLYYDNKNQIGGKELINLFRDSMHQGIKR